MELVDADDASVTKRSTTWLSVCGADVMVAPFWRHDKPDWRMMASRVFQLTRKPYRTHPGTTTVPL